MAVQAQYPPNALLNRGDGNVSSLGGSLQKQSGVFYFDQSEMLLNNFAGVGVNERKRVREDAITCASPELSHIQIQTHNVSTGLQLAFGDQTQKHKLYIQERIQQQEQSILSDDLEKLLHQQNHEINRFLHSQGEHFRRTLVEKHQLHYRTLLSNAEERLKKTETDAEVAIHRHAWLKARAVQLQSELRIWQGKAKAGEAAALSIHEQLKKRAGEVDNNDGGAEDESSAIVDRFRIGVSESDATTICKACRDGAATVVLLPCRHLCVCGGCNDAVQACPLCLSHVKSRLHVLLS